MKHKNLRRYDETFTVPMTTSNLVWTHVTAALGLQKTKQDRRTLVGSTDSYVAAVRHEMSLKNAGVIHWDGGSVAHHGVKDAYTSWLEVAWWMDYTQTMHVRVIGGRCIARIGPGPGASIGEAGFESVYRELLALWDS